MCLNVKKYFLHRLVLFLLLFLNLLKKNEFVGLKTIKGTQKLHSFIPISENQTLARRFSFQEAYEELRLI